MKALLVFHFEQPFFRQLVASEGPALVDRAVRATLEADPIIVNGRPENAVDQELNYFAAKYPQHAVMAFTHKKPTNSKLLLAAPVHDLHGLGVTEFKSEVARISALFCSRIKYLSSLMNDLKYMRGFLLPVENFDPEVHYDIWSYFVERVLDADADFVNEFQTRWAELNKRRTPKRFSAFKAVYFKSRNDLFFEYGHEIHAQQEHKGDGHTAICSLSAMRRMSLPYDNRRHYNVSLDQSNLQGRNFVNCHSVTVTAAKEKHQNIFANDFTK